MTECPGRFDAASEKELWQHLELHGRLAHQEDPARWTREEKDTIQRLIRRTGK